MPNTGKPSPACHLCRGRRVKCDLTRPRCLRCSKLGTVCPGYREEQDLLFNNKHKETFSAIGRKQRRRSGREAVGQDSSSAELSFSDPSLSLPPVRDEMSLPNHQAAIRSHSPPLLLKEDWRSYSVPVALRQFLAPTSGNGSRSHDFLEFLPDLYSETSDGSCLNMATHAVAMAYISNTSGAFTKTYEHVQTYGRALRATNVALRDPLESVKDSTIIAVWLLGVHEVIVNPPNTFSDPLAPPGSQSWHAHADGIAALLRERGPHQFSTKRGRNLFWQMYIFIQTHCLVADAECPPQLLTWFEQASHGLTEVDQLAFTCSKYISQIPVLFSKMHRLFRSSNTFTNEYVALQATSIFAETDALEYQSHNWIALAQLQPTNVCSLQVVNNFRAAFLKLQHFSISLLDRLVHHPLVHQTDIRRRRQRCIAITHLLSREILNSLPHGLKDDSLPQGTGSGCWQDGTRMLFPLIVVLWMKHGLQHHREEAKLALRRIGLKNGIKLALECDPPIRRLFDK